ncbi:MAG: tetratricopeptide repeat protein, partial [Planctomycetota bacterium]
MAEETKENAVETKTVPEMTLEALDGIISDPTPELEPFWEVYRVVRYSQRHRRALIKLVEDLQGKGEIRNLEKAVRVGSSLWILGEYTRAHELLKNTRVNITGAFFLGQVLTVLGRAEEGAEILEKTVNRKPQSDVIRTAHVEALLRAGLPEKAVKAIREMEKTLGKTAKTHVLRGWAQDLLGSHNEARECYRKALELEPDHGEALFRLAYSMDLYGDDEEAVRLYQKCMNLPHPNINALINLGVLMEDQGEFDAAVQCYEQVLKQYPNHPRAKNFLKDALASLEEQVDEERERMEDRRW